VIANDGVLPLSGLGGCGETADGRCALPKFVDGLKELIRTTDWKWACHGDWVVLPGEAWNTTVGYPPEKQ
jgi:hypothetical protein